MRFYGKRSGRNNIPGLLVRSYKFNNRSRKDTTKLEVENKEKEKTFLQKKSFEEYNDSDWFFCIMFVIVAIIIALISIN